MRECVSGVSAYMGRAIEIAALRLQPPVRGLTSPSARPRAPTPASIISIEQLTALATTANFSIMGMSIKPPPTGDRRNSVHVQKTDNSAHAEATFASPP
ncbi:MAG TPA: hypothetical protein VEX86_13725, partial [Longimicrobium sp.]|nr:hypothetical protein [Longimicrobium sp.]